jgi:hypothetical protein
MGREIRRVPLNYEPPRQTCQYIHGWASDPCPGWHWHPQFAESYTRALAEWQDGKQRWESGEDPDALNHPDYTWEDWEGESPDPAYYRPEWPEGTPLGYCFYETTSEGTPISPVFATTDELAAWLVEHEGMSQDGAARFVASGWVPSLISMPGVGVLTGMDAIDRGVIG